MGGSEREILAWGHDVGTERSEVLVTESQIFFCLAQPNSINKYFIIHTAVIKICWKCQENACKCDRKWTKPILTLYRLREISI